MAFFVAMISRSCNSFKELHAKLKSGDGQYGGADPEDKDEYVAENFI